MLADAKNSDFGELKSSKEPLPLTSLQAFNAVSLVDRQINVELLLTHLVILLKGVKKPLPKLRPRYPFRDAEPDYDRASVKEAHAFVQEVLDSWKDERVCFLTSTPIC